MIYFNWLAHFHPTAKDGSKTRLRGLSRSQDRKTYNVCCTECGGALSVTIRRRVVCDDICKTNFDTDDWGCPPSKTKRIPIKIYTVVEEDRGEGICGIGSYLSEERADKEAEKSSHYYIIETEIKDNPENINKKEIYEFHVGWTIGWSSR